MDIEGGNLCPVCDQTRPAKKFKSLYGYLICDKCYYGFANRRQGAFILDSLIFRLALLPISIGLSVLLAALNINMESNAVRIADGLLGIVLWVIFLGKDGWFGNSPGKRITGIQVIDETTRGSVSFVQSVKRNLPLVIPFVPVVVACTLSKGKRWGDGWAGTRVIWKKYADKLPFSAREMGPNPPSSGSFFLLYVVIFIFVLLMAAIAVPNFIRARDQARNSAAAPAVVTP